MSGIGDHANYGVAANQPGSLAVKKGDTYFSVQVRNVAAGDVQAKETTLAKDILAKL